MQEEDFRAAGYDTYVSDGSALCFRGPHAHAILATGVHYCGAGGVVLLNLEGICSSPSDPKELASFQKFAQVIFDVLNEMHAGWQVSKVIGVVVQEGNKR